MEIGWIEYPEQSHYQSIGPGIGPYAPPSRPESHDPSLVSRLDTVDPILDVLSCRQIDRRTRSRTNALVEFVDTVEIPSHLEAVGNVGISHPPRFVGLV